MKDKILSFLKNVFNKCIKPLFNKKWKLCIWGVIILVLIVGSIIIKSTPKKYADQALEFLEDEGFECETTFEGSEKYLCEYESESGIMHSFTISWGDGLSPLDLLTWASGFSVTYDFKDEEDEWYYFGREVFRKNYYGVYAYSEVIGDSDCLFVAADWKDDYENYIDDDADVAALNDEVCDYEDNCISCSLYEKDVNYALDVFRNLYDELELDLYDE